MTEHNEVEPATTYYDEAMERIDKFQLYMQPDTVVIPAAEYEQLKADAERYRKLRLIMNKPNGSIFNNNCMREANFWCRTVGRDGNTTALTYPKDDELDLYVDKHLHEAIDELRTKK